MFGMIALLFVGVGDALYFQDKQTSQLENLSKDIKGLTEKLSDLNILYSSALSDFGARLSQMEENLKPPEPMQFGDVRPKGG